MKEEENKRQKHSAGGTKKAEQKCSQSDQPKSSEPDLPLQQGFAEAVKEGQASDPSELRRDSLLGAIGRFNERERKARFKKVLARKGRPQ